jgi:hypothetical protein
VHLPKSCTFLCKGDTKRLGINIHEQPVLEIRKLKTERNAKTYLAILENEFELLSQKIK